MALGFLALDGDLGNTWGFQMTFFVIAIGESQCESGVERARVRVGDAQQIV
jgi:hypothetical protein